MAAKITQAVILAAGLGVRLRSITDSKIPKVMVPIGGKPLLQWHIERLRDYGVKEIYINLFYLPDVVQGYFGRGSKWDVDIDYFIEKPDIKGTAGGIKSFEGKLRSDFLVCYGDTFNFVDFSQLAEEYYRRPDTIVLTTIGDNDHPHDSDLVVVDDNLRFIKIYPKPHKSLPPEFRTMKAAAFIFNQEVLKFIPPDTYYEIDHQLLPDLLKKGKKVYGWQSRDYIQDIGTPRRYKKALEYLQNNPQLLSGKP